MSSMERLEFGPLQGVRVEIGPNREPSLRAALASLLQLLDKGDQDGANSLLNHEVTYHGKPCALGAVLSSSIDRLADDVLKSTMGGEILDTIPRESRDSAIRKATVKLGAPDRAESEALSKRFEVEVFAWASGEVLAFARWQEGRFRDVTEDVLDMLEADEGETEELPRWGGLGDKIEPEPDAVQLAQDLEDRVEGRPLEPVTVAEAACGDPGEPIPPPEMCGLCAQDIQPGAPEAAWPTDDEVSAVAVHLQCRREEVARRKARGLYGTATQMREELAMRGRPVGEVWDIGELESLVLQCRRETDDIDWASYATKTAQRKQGRPCLICGDPITKTQDYKQASRGRKAHRTCVVKAEDANERAAIQAAEPDIFAQRK